MHLMRRPVTNRHVFIVMALTLSSALPAQTTVADRLSCTSCAVQTRLVMTLGAKDGPGALPEQPVSATVDSQGRIWLLFYLRAPFLFARDGTFIREVGRIGQGPGEFQRPWRIAAVGDSIAVFEQLGALTVLGPNLQFVRTASASPVSQPRSIAVLDWPRSVLVAGMSRRPANVGRPLHVMNFAVSPPTILRSFGADGVMPEVDVNRLIQGYPDTERLLERKVAASGRDAMFAVTTITEYAVTKWDSSGGMTWQLKRESAAFPNKETWTMGSSTTPPDSRMAAIWYDSRRYLWTYAHVAAPNWQQARRDFNVLNPPPPPPPPGSGRATMGVPASRLIPEHSLYQTLIEVLDVESRSLVARLQFSGFVVGVLPDGRFLSYREATDGTPYLDLNTATLLGR